MDDRRSQPRPSTPTGHPHDERPRREAGGTITTLLQRWNAGDEEAVEEVLPLVYDELHRIAVDYFRGERRDHTLQPTAVLNEVFLRLLERDNIEWRNGAHLIGTAARMMRHLLVDHAREKKSLKRGGEVRRVPLAEAASLSLETAPDLVRLDAALERLAAVDPLKAKIVELRFFGGLTIAETAAYLEVSEATVTRQWRRARAWLYGEIEAENGDGGS